MAESHLVALMSGPWCMLAHCFHGSLGHLNRGVVNVISNAFASPAIEGHYVCYDCLSAAQTVQTEEV